MIVIKNLKVSSKDYFDCITHYLVKDLRKNVDKSIKAKDIHQGFTFYKTYHSKEGPYKAKHVIEALDYGKAYQLKIHLPFGEQIISHHIKEIKDNEIEVRYEEVVKSSKLSIKLLQFSKRTKSRKVMNDLLVGLEAEITLK